MAGIGFELKKLFIESKNEPFGNVKSILFSSVISVGPWAYNCHFTKSSNFSF